MAPPEVRAVPLAGQSIQLDGRLDEDAWRSALPATDFRQNQPREGEPATQRTEVRFLFDEAAIYVGARMFDDSGAAGVRTRLVRRDGQIDDDYVQVIFDTYHDHIGRLFFLVNPSGVRADANGLGGGGDYSWDPVWEVKTNIDSLGWTAEMRIPFSQMRYPSTREEQTWGLQIWRQANRLNELSQWSFWGLTESGGPPRFGHLTGLVITRAPGRVELLPYVVGRSQSIPVSDPADPFQDDNETDGRIGGDARVLLTSNLTLNATINPDFGQVEVDPAVVNLSAFETFFDEKRPFFVEGAGYFGFGGLNCYFCSNVSSLSMFYSRRIGRAPQVPGAAFAEGPYADIPENTAIVGAAKLTGRTRSGWSVGIMDAFTKRERALVERSDGSRTRRTVEPAANYFVGRLAKDFRGGATVVRGMFTSVYRGLGDDRFLRDRLNRHSESFGLSSDMFFGRRDYRLMLQLAGSQVTGDTAAILRLQQSSARYFQRPDRGNGANGLFSDAYDPSRTVLRGGAAYARFSRETGNVLWELQTNIRTPGFENNDIAFLSRADYFWMNGNMMRQWTRPSSWYRSLFFIIGGQQQYNFDGDLTDRQGQIYGQITPHNYWNISTFYFRRPSVFDDRMTRGGPVVRVPGLHYWSANINSDSRRAIVVGGNVNLACGDDGDCDQNQSLSVQLRPAPNIAVSFGPGFGVNRTKYQFVTAVADLTATAFANTRYVFGRLVQKSISMDTRLNVTFTTNLTLELYAQPLIASGRFADYREFAAPRSGRQLVFGADTGTVARLPGAAGQRDTIRIDPDGTGPATSFDFLEPSFTLRSLRGNAVLRWEYLPGSTLFLVWARSSSSQLLRGDLQFREDAGALFEGEAENVFLIKVNYRVGF